MTAEFIQHLLQPSPLPDREIDADLVNTRFVDLLTGSLHDLKTEVVNAGFTDTFFEKWRLNSETLLSYWQQRIVHLTKMHPGKLESMQIGDSIDLGDQWIRLDSFRDLLANNFYPSIILSWIRGSEHDDIHIPKSGYLEPSHVDLAMRGKISRPNEKYYSKDTYEVRFEEKMISRIVTRRFYQKDRKNHVLLGTDTPSGAHIEDVLDLSWLFARDDFTVEDLFR